MTNLEKDVLAALKEDARLTAKKIAAMLGKTEEEIKACIRALENNGTLVKYTAIINEELADSTSVEALIEVRVTPKKGEGFDGMIFAICDYKKSGAEYDALMARGYDFRFSYTNSYKPAESYPSEEDVIEGQKETVRKKFAEDALRFVPTVSCFWDPTPRTTKHWIDMGYTFHLSKIWHLSPEGFRQVLRDVKVQSDALPDGAWGRKILMLDNWNEWDEGHFIAPSHKFGYKYLQAVREELTERENLPDYRTPQDMGLSGNLNKSWPEPDFAELCEEMLKNK